MEVVSMKENIENMLQQIMTENDRLKRELEELKKENEHLKQHLQENRLKTDVQPSNKQIIVEQKLKARIHLFNRLFKGRNDVFAYRWVTKKGSAGFSPARKGSKNEFYPLTDD